MRPFSLVLVVLCAAVAVAAPVPQDKEKSTAEKLIGKWKLTATGVNWPEGASATVEYTKDNKMIITITINDNEIVMKGTYKLDKDKIDYKVTMPDGGEKTEILTIKKLTEEELVTTDPDDIKEEFKRMKEEKKAEKKEEKKKD